MKADALSRVVWRVSLPIILAQASESLLHLIDTIFLSRVGVTELGALAVADSLLLLFLVVPLALVDGIQILTARRAGQRRPQAVGAMFNQGFVLVFAVCIASTVALKLVSPIAVRWFVETDAVGAAVDEFLQIAAYGIAFGAASFAYSALLVSLGRTRVLIPATIVLATTNIVLGYIFIFGRLGAPALGMRGAAIGSVGAEIAACVFLTVYVWRAIDSSRYEFFRAWTVVQAILVTVPFIMIALLAPEWFLAAFKPGADVLVEGAASLRVVALAMLIVIPGQIWFAAVSGTGDTAAALGIELIVTVTMIGAAYLAAIQFTWPVELVWMSLPASWLVCLTISYGWVKSGLWKRLEIY